MNKSFFESLGYFVGIVASIIVTSVIIPYFLGLGIVSLLEVKVATLKYPNFAMWCLGYLVELVMLRLSLEVIHRFRAGEENKK